MQVICIIYWKWDGGLFTIQGTDNINIESMKYKYSKRHRKGCGRLLPC